MKTFKARLLPLLEPDQVKTWRKGEEHLERDVGRCCNISSRPFWGRRRKRQDIKPYLFISYHIFYVHPWDISRISWRGGYQKRYQGGPNPPHNFCRRPISHLSPVSLRDLFISTGPRVALNLCNSVVYFGLIISTREEKKSEEAIFLDPPFFPLITLPSLSSPLFIFFGSLPTPLYTPLDRLFTNGCQQ